MKVEVPKKVVPVLRKLRVHRKKFLAVQEVKGGFAICTKMGTILVDKNYVFLRWAPVTVGETSGTNATGHKLPASGGPYKGLHG